MHSERPRHRMMEQWHPLGPVGIISAFNFPVAVWAWNSALAAVCGDSMIWKPSEFTPLTAIATTKIAQRVLAANGAPPIMNLVIGDRLEVGERMVKDSRIPLISATGSVRMGRRVAQLVAERLGRTLLELGGNNGVVVMDDADLDLTFRAILFGAVGTAGQRCTTTRRLFLQRGIAAEMKRRLTAAYPTVPIGDPLAAGTLMGPLVHEGAVGAYQRAIAQAQAEGGELLCGGKLVARPGHFVEPAIVAMPAQSAIVCEETFAPILYVIEFDTLDEVIAIHNAVPQGLSSAIFTLNMRQRRPVPVGRRQRLRHRQRQPRHLGRRDRRRLRRREGDRRRPRVRLRLLEGLHAAADQHRQLGQRPAARPGRRVHGLNGFPELSAPECVEPPAAGERPGGAGTPRRPAAAAGG